jgi:tight adherence protein B
VGMAIVMLNPDYFMRMWDDTTGQLLVFGAIGLQMLGAALLYRLARLS